MGSTTTSRTSRANPGNIMPGCWKRMVTRDLPGMHSRALLEVNHAVRRPVEAELTATHDSDAGYFDMKRRFGHAVIAITAGLALLAPAPSQTVTNIRRGAVLDPSFANHGVRE